MRVALFALLWFLAPVAAAAAGVVVIDPANGPGTDYTSITDYLLGTPANGDVLLLRSGTYEGGVVSVQTISFVADAGADVHFVNSGTGVFGGNALMVGASGGGAALVRGLTFSTPDEGGVPLAVTGSAPGSFVFVEECSVPTSGAAGATFGNGGRTAISRCTFHGSIADETGGSTVYGIEGKPGAVVTQGRLAIFGSEFVGGRGLDAGLYGGEPLDAMAGSPGVMTLDGTSALKVFSSTVMTGGTGGDGAFPGGCLMPGDGGDGVLVLSGSGVKAVAVTGALAAGGIGAPGCGPDGATGELLAHFPSAEAPAVLPGSPATVVLSRVVREGQSAQLTLQNASGHYVALLIGFAPQFTYLEKFSGVLVVSASSVIGIGTLPGPGSVTFSATVPELAAGVESLIVYVQPLSLDPQGHKVLGSPSAMLMLDDSF
ncbi:MAG TPA: hypothetical protein VES36_07175 [Candidatus Limnocylindrales bacterium]|nr:hypothetical protein [Candidatus Limnocylindrales bacterium]